MIRPTFAELERHYRTAIQSAYENTCAIRMSLALFETVPGADTLFKIHGKSCLGEYLITGAQDLAAFLRREWGVPDQSWAGTRGNPVGNGVICYMNIPSYSGQGHIGLWKDGAPFNDDAYWSASPIWFWRLD